VLVLYSGRDPWPSPSVLFQSQMYDSVYEPMEQQASQLEGPPPGGPGTCCGGGFRSGSGYRNSFRNGTHSFPPVSCRGIVISLRNSFDQQSSRRLRTNATAVFPPGAPWQVEGERAGPSGRRRPCRLLSPGPEYINPQGFFLSEGAACPRRTTGRSTSRGEIVRATGWGHGCGLYGPEFGSISAEWQTRAHAPGKVGVG